MFEVRQIISVFSKMRLERKKFGNHRLKGKRPLFHSKFACVMIMCCFLNDNLFYQ